MLLKGGKRLPETHRDSLLLLCYSPVFSEQFDLDKNCALTDQGQVEQKMGNLAYEQALVFGPGAWAAKPYQGTCSHANAEKH